MQVAKHIRETVTVLALDGDLDSRTAPGVQKQLDELMPGRGLVLLDLSETSYMSSAGLRVLLLAHRHAQKVGTRLALAGLSSEVRAVMSATGFLEFFTVTDTVDAGIAALAGCNSGSTSQPPEVP